MLIGEKLKRLRLRTNLTQEELAIRCDLSKSFISLIERDQSSPSIATLLDILESLGTNPAEFFREEAPEPVYQAEDAYSISDEELGHTITWIIPGAQKYGMEPILVSLRAGGRTKAYSPHAGEIYGYVLDGEVTLWIGDQNWRVLSGNSFYYIVSGPYYLENTGDHESKILWVSSPPNF